MSQKGDVIESLHNKQLQCRIKTRKPRKIGPSEPFPRTSAAVRRDGACFWRFHDQVYVLFATHLPYFPSIQIVFKCRTVFISRQRTSYKPSSLTVQLQLHSENVKEATASRSGGICLDCVSPAKTQRAFHLQKSQVSRDARVHTCEKRAPWVPSACGQEYDWALGRRRER